MDRAPVSIAILLAAAACLADEPPVAAPPAVDAATATLPAVSELIESVARVEPEAEPVIAAETAVAPAPAETEAAATGHDAAPTAETAPAAVATVDMKKVTDDTVCRKERPTGSQIGVMRCYSRSASTLSTDEQMRRDVDEMRMRQNEQQAREAAAAMTRRRPAQ